MTTSAPSTKQNLKLNLGGESVSAQGGYVKMINDIYYKITNQADTQDKIAMAWHLEFLTRRLLATIIKSSERDMMLEAFNDIFLLNCAEKMPIPNRRYTRTELLKLLDKEDRADAMIESCMFMTGEYMEYSDKYIGLETKLAIME